MITLVFDGWHPRSKNRSTGKRAAFALRDEKLLVDRVAKDYKQATNTSDATSPMSVSIEIHKGPRGRSQDEDNLQHQKKVILDGLSKPRGRKKIGASLIVDDSPNWVVSTITEHFNTGFVGTIVHIKKLDKE